MGLLGDEVAGDDVELRIALRMGELVGGGGGTDDARGVDPLVGEVVHAVGGGCALGDAVVGTGRADHLDLHVGVVGPRRLAVLLLVVHARGRQTGSFLGVWEVRPAFHVHGVLRDRQRAHLTPSVFVLHMEGRLLRILVPLHASSNTHILRLRLHLRLRTLDVVGLVVRDTASSHNNLHALCPINLRALLVLAKHLQWLWLLHTLVAVLAWLLLDLERLTTVVVQLAAFARLAHVQSHLGL